MIFNSISFAIFLPIVFLIYWSINNSKNRIRNFILLLSSYFFYSCWDFKFLILLIFSTFLDFYTGYKIHRSIKLKSKRIWLIISLTVNIGILCFFKYYNFFADSLEKLVKTLGFNIEISLLNLLLPIGISFYTFHGISYVFDIYKEKIKPEKDFIIYSLFVAYFPLLVAGPIERANHLLPQLKITKNFNYENAVLGLKQILWGLFKKIVIADNCAQYVDSIYNYESAYNGSSFFVATVLFAFQIYGDFSGYSDIALGTSRLFGIELIKNFSFPYFSRDIAEFWRKWHISLSSWFKDYLYIPLGGSQNGIYRGIINTFIIFTVSGFWHGANWTFLFWGGLHALFFIPLFIIGKHRINTNSLVAYSSLLPNIKELLQMVFTFLLVCFGWVFFRSNNIDVAFRIYSKLFSSTIFDSLLIEPPYQLILFILFMILIEWNNRCYSFGLEKTGYNLPSLFRYGLYFFLIFSIFWFGTEEKQFIYFQF